MEERGFFCSSLATSMLRLLLALLVGPGVVQGKDVGSCNASVIINATAIGKLNLQTLKACRIALVRWHGRLRFTILTYTEPTLGLKAPCGQHGCLHASAWRQRAGEQPHGAFPFDGRPQN